MSLRAGLPRPRGRDDVEDVLLGARSHQVDEAAAADEPGPPVQHLVELTVVETGLARRPGQPLDERERPPVLVELPGRVEVFLRTRGTDRVELPRAAHRLDPAGLRPELR